MMETNQMLILIGSNIAIMLLIFGSTISLFLWARSEAREDQAELRYVLRQDNLSIQQLIREIKEEMKDFHDRLCEIERSKRR